jgi:hypothetical protein
MGDEQDFMTENKFFRISFNEEVNDRSGSSISELLGFWTVCCPKF